MFFEKCDQKNIDGKIYDISNGAKVDCFNCKESISEVFRFMDPETMAMECTFDNWQGWKKDLIKICKEWEKCYTKHVKSTYPEMNAIHMQAMQPLNQLVEANANFDRLERMVRDKKEVPHFR